MNLSTREDIEAPVDYVFTALSDFGDFERAALRRGAEVTRTDDLGAIGPGAAWRAQFEMRGKPRRLDVTLSEFVQPRRMRFDGMSKNVEGELVYELHELSPRRTRVLVKLEMRPLSLPARIALQSLRLAKKRTDAKFSRHMRDFAREIENRYRGGSA